MSPSHKGHKLKFWPKKGPFQYQTKGFEIGFGELEFTSLFELRKISRIRTLLLTYEKNPVCMKSQAEDLKVGFN